LWFVLLGLVFMLFQFIGPAIVVVARSATSAIGKSVGVFTSNPLSVIGYTFLRGFSFSIIMAIPFALVVAGGLQTASAGPGATPGFDTTSPLALVGSLLLLVVLPVAYGFFMMYHTTYYYRVTDGDRQGGQSNGPPQGGQPDNAPQGGQSDNPPQNGQSNDRPQAEQGEQGDDETGATTGDEDEAADATEDSDDERDRSP
jgi:hypothetical protein